jgi:RND family efflux transporter MFP subunit
VERYTNLVRDKTTSADKLDEVKSKWKSALGALGSAAAKIEQADADILVAKERADVAHHDAERVADLLRYATITAPPGGKEVLYVVNRRWADPGSFLQPGAGGQREAVVSLMRVDQVRVVVNVQELDAARVQPGDPAVFLPTALPGQRFEGKVARFSSSLELPSRRMRVEIDLPNPDGRSLYPGMYGNATIILDAASNRFVLPVETVKKQEGKAFVYTVANGKAERVEVKLGREMGNQVEVIGGLQETTPVIRGSPAGLQSGAVVEVEAKKR